MGRASGLEPLGLGLDSRGEEALYRRNASRVFGFCLSRLGRREDAEDALQTTFLHAVRSLRRGVVPLVESAWLLGIARNVCRERWEAAGRRSRLESSCDPQELDGVSVAPDVRREELIGLEDALTHLPEQQRRAILLRDWRGLSYAEVAEQLGVSQAAVETLIFRGRAGLADLLRETPRTTRRLGAIGNLGSLLGGLKALLTGGAAAKAVAVVAVVAAGVGTGTAISGDQRPQAPATTLRATPQHIMGATPSVTAQPRPGVAPSRASRPAAATPKTVRTQPAVARLETARPATPVLSAEPGPIVPAAPPEPAPAQLQATVSPQPPAPIPAATTVTEAAAPISDTVDTVTDAVTEPVAALLPPPPDLPVDIPVAPLPVPSVPAPPLPTPQLPALPLPVDPPLLP